MMQTLWRSTNIHVYDRGKENLLTGGFSNKILFCLPIQLKSTAIQRIILNTLRYFTKYFFRFVKLSILKVTIYNQGILKSCTTALHTCTCVCADRQLQHTGPSKKKFFLNLLSISYSEFNVFILSFLLYMRISSLETRALTELFILYIYFRMTVLFKLPRATFELSKS